MIVGKVIGSLELSRGIGEADRLRWVQVKTERGILAALDPVGVEREALVLLTEGESASRLCQEIPTDAAVVGILRCPGNNG